MLNSYTLITTKTKRMIMIMTDSKNFDMSITLTAGDTAETILSLDKDLVYKQKLFVYNAKILSNEELKKLQDNVGETTLLVFNARTPLMIQNEPTHLTREIDTANDFLV